MKKHLNVSLTLRSHENHWYFVHVPEVRHLAVVIVDCIEARLVLQAEDKYHCVDPRGELRREK